MKNFQTILETVFSALFNHRFSYLKNSESENVILLMLKMLFLSVNSENYLDTFKNCDCRCSCHGAAETHLSRNHEVVGSIPVLAQWVKDLLLP